MERSAHRNHAKGSSCKIEFKESSLMLYTSTIDELLHNLDQLDEESVTETTLVDIIRTALEKLSSELYVGFNKLIRNSIGVSIESTPRVVFDKHHESGDHQEDHDLPDNDSDVKLQHTVISSKLARLAVEKTSLQSSQLRESRQSNANGHSSVKRPKRSARKSGPIKSEKKVKRVLKKEKKSDDVIDPATTEKTDSGADAIHETDNAESLESQLDDRRVAVDTNGDGEYNSGEDENDGVQKWSCEICSSTFVHERSLAAHNRLKHPVEGLVDFASVSTLWYCIECKEYFYQLQRVREHVKNKHEHEAKLNNEPESVTDFPSCIHVLRKPAKRCKTCEKDFWDFRSLKQHVFRMHIERDGAFARCYECDLEFPSARLLQRHYRVNHFDIFTHNSQMPDDAPVICFVCGKMIANKKELSQHLFVLHKRTNSELTVLQEETKIMAPVDCPVCNRSFAGDRRLQSHIKSKHQVNNVYQCNVCKTAFDELESLTEHSKPCREARNKCPTCGKTFRTHRYMQLHQKTHSDHKPFKCNICSTAYKCKRTLSYHEATVHKSKTGGVICELCDKVFSCQVTMKAHVNRCHIGQRDHICEHCARPFFSKRDLEVHILRRHQAKTNHQCQHCQKYFPLACNLKKHIKDVHRKATIPCEVCGKFFKTPALLKNHMNVHTRKKAFFCSICGAQFLWLTSLEQHTELHHNDGSTRYSCTECGEEFMTKRRLYLHKRRVCGDHPKRTYPCQYCDVVLSQSYSLARHMRRKHPDMLDEFQNSQTHHNQFTSRQFSKARSTSQISRGSGQTVYTVRRPKVQIVRQAEADEAAEVDEAAESAQVVDVMPVEYEVQNMVYEDVVEQVENIIHVSLEGVIAESVAETVIYQ